MKKFAPLFLISLGLFADTAMVEKIQESALVIYNANKAFVHEKRTLHVVPQTTQIAYSGVASTIEPDSVDVSFPKGVTLYSQQYRYDKLNLYNLLETYLNKEVRLKQDNNTTVKATLLSTGGRVVLQTQDARIITANAHDLIFDSVPKTLHNKPSLVWNVKVDREIQQEMSIDYLIDNISFRSDYVLSLDDETADLTGWLTIKNNSGKTFTNTRLSLVAGDVHFVHNTTPHPMRSYKMANTLAMAAPATQHKAYGGYHLYTLPSHIDIADKATTQVQFLTQNDIAVQRLYEVHLSYPLSLHAQQKADVVQSLVFQTTQPLPQGVVRVYGAIQEHKVLLGEAKVAHTAKNGHVKLTLGNNFDLEATQTLLESEQRKGYKRSLVRYTVKNSSDETKKVTLFVPFSKEKNAKVTSNQPYVFTKGNVVTFTLNIIPNATATFVAEYELKK